MAAALLPVPMLDPSKLTVAYLSADAAAPGALARASDAPRRYTITHNDLTARLRIAVGDAFDARALAGPWSRVVRDEVLAEWRWHAGAPALHLHCRVSVSGGAAWWWPVPARYRAFVFRREMPLVLDGIAFAERTLFAEQSALRAAPILVHFVAIEVRQQSTSGLRTCRQRNPRSLWASCNMAGRTGSHASCFSVPTRLAPPVPLSPIVAA